MQTPKELRFREDYNRLVQPIFRYIYYKCGDRAEAQDLTQECFVKYWEKLETVDVKGSSSYVYMIASNLLANKYNKDKIKLKFRDSIVIEDEKQDPQYLLEYQDCKEKLASLISEMPPTQREVLLMHRIDGMKYKEIAEKLSISVKAVEKRMHLALLKIKTLSNND